jgi:N-acetylmuramate 1-kinase
LDKRLQALRSWVSGTVAGPVFELQPASGDASFRRYFRVRAAECSYIAIDSPPQHYDARDYVRIAARLRKLGLNVPQVLHQDLDHGFLLVTDLGDALYLTKLNDVTVEHLYGDALHALQRLQSGNRTDDDFLPDYGEGLLTAEMELFRVWYLRRHLGLVLTQKQQRILDQTFAALTRSALEQPRVWVHRDYHSRNLMVTAENNPGILDFQDAVRGPVTYDLVSLLRDCYIAWPRGRVERWAGAYHAQALAAAIPVCEQASQFLQWFDRMGVQRHLKAIGIFARLNHRDGKPGYLQDVPRTLGYVLEVSGRDELLLPLSQLLRELRLPDAGQSMPPS